MDYHTGNELEGQASKELVAASRTEHSGTAAVAAYCDGDGTWQHVPDSKIEEYERRGETVLTVYVQPPREWPED